MEFITHDFVGEATGDIAFFIRGECVFIRKVKVRWDVACGLGSKAESR